VSEHPCSQLLSWSSYCSSSVNELFTPVLKRKITIFLRRENTHTTHTQKHNKHCKARTQNLASRIRQPQNRLLLLYSGPAHHESIIKANSCVVAAAAAVVVVVVVQQTVQALVLEHTAPTIAIGGDAACVAYSVAEDEDVIGCPVVDIFLGVSLIV